MTGGEKVWMDMERGADATGLLQERKLVTKTVQPNRQS